MLSNIPVDRLKGKILNLVLNYKKVFRTPVGSG